MPIHPEDMELVSRVVNSDEEAANQFGNIYFARFEYLAHKAGVSPQDCQDVAQDALLAAISQMRRGLFRGESRLGTWLEKIIQGKIAEYWRAKAHAGRLVTDSSLDDPEMRIDSVEKLRLPAVNHETILTVRFVLLELPAHQRAILLLNRTEGYTLEEISRALDMTIGQVSKRLYKAEELFRRALREAEGGQRMIPALSLEAKEKNRG